ncbi:multidrug efflux pump subunit AcrA (membrane-fusion protein) [Luteibacter sp. HA06]
MSDATQAKQPRHKGRRLLIVSIVAIVIIALVLFHVISGSGKKKPVTPPQLVSAAKATLGDMPEILNELGTVTPVATVNVLPQLSGYLTDVGYKEGQDVEKGQFLAADRSAPVRDRQTPGPGPDGKRQGGARPGARGPGSLHHAQ